MHKEKVTVMSLFGMLRIRNHIYDLKPLNAIRKSQCCGETVEPLLTKELAFDWPC